jgi:hypothetical protein
MSVRVVARIRPLLNTEIEKDVIVHAAHAAGAESADTKTVVKIPNATQAQVFDNEGMCCVSRRVGPPY